MRARKGNTFKQMLIPKVKMTGSSGESKARETKAGRWVLNNLKTKLDSKEDLVDGATNLETSVELFGEIEFKGATRRAKSKVSLIMYFMLFYNHNAYKHAQPEMRVNPLLVISLLITSHESLVASH